MDTQVEKGLSLNNLMRSRRYDIGMTQEELSEKLGISRTWLNKLERGSVDPRLGFVGRWCEALGFRVMLDIKEIKE